MRLVAVLAAGLVAGFAPSPAPSLTGVFPAHVLTDVARRNADVGAKFQAWCDKAVGYLQQEVDGQDAALSESGNKVAQASGVMKGIQSELAQQKLDALPQPGQSGLEAAMGAMERSASPEATQLEQQRVAVGIELAAANAAYHDAQVLGRNLAGTLGSVNKACYQERNFEAEVQDLLHPTAAVALARMKGRLLHGRILRGQSQRRGGDSSDDSLDTALMGKEDEPSPTPSPTPYVDHAAIARAEAARVAAERHAAELAEIQRRKAEEARIAAEKEAARIAAEQAAAAEAAAAEDARRPAAAAEAAALAAAKKAEEDEKAAALAAAEKAAAEEKAAKEAEEKRIAEEKAAHEAAVRAEAEAKAAEEAAQKAAEEAEAARRAAAEEARKQHALETLMADQKRNATTDSFKARRAAIVRQEEECKHLAANAATVAAAKAAAGVSTEAAAAQQAARSKTYDDTQGTFEDLVTALTSLQTEADAIFDEERQLYATEAMELQKASGSPAAAEATKKLDAQHTLWMAWRKSFDAGFAELNKFLSLRNTQLESSKANIEYLRADKSPHMQFPKEDPPNPGLHCDSAAEIQRKLEELDAQIAALNDQDFGEPPPLQIERKGMPDVPTGPAAAPMTGMGPAPPAAALR
jgi:hypothetical protein